MAGKISEYTTEQTTLDDTDRLDVSTDLAGTPTTKYLSWGSLKTQLGTAGFAQSGDNVSIFANDAGYLTSGDGNGIYDGSGTLSGATTVTMGGNTLTFDEEVIINDSKIGTFAGAAFAHRNFFSSANVALIQDGSGATQLNSASGQTTRISIGGGDAMQLNSDGIGLGGTAPNADTTIQLDSPKNIKADDAIFGTLLASGYAGLKQKDVTSYGFLQAPPSAATDGTLINVITGKDMTFRINNSLNGTLNALGWGFKTAPTSGNAVTIGGNTQIDGQLEVNLGNSILGGLNNIVAIGTNGETQDSTIAFRVKSNRGTLFSFEDYISAVSSTVRLSLSGGGRLLGTNLDHTSRVYLGTPTTWGGSTAQLAIKGSSGSYSLYTEGSTANVGIAISNGASNVGLGAANNGPYKVFISNSNAQGTVLRVDGSTQVRQLEIVDNGGIGINGTPVADTVLDVQSTTATLRLPRLSTTTRDGLSSPVTGMFIYNSTTNKLNFYNGSAWEAVTSV